MNYLALLNNVPIEIGNDEEINYSWQTNFPSPNPTFTFTNQIELRDEAYKVYQNFIQAKKVYNSIPFTFRDNLTGDLLFNGRGLPYSSNTKVDKQIFTAYLEIVEKQLESVLDSLQIATITNREIRYYKQNIVLQDKTRTEIQTVQTLLGIVVMLLELINATRDTLTLIDINPFDLGDIAIAVALLIIQAAVVILAIISFVDSLRPQTRRYNAVRVLDIFKVACQKLGLGFKSSILESSTWNKLTIIANTDYEGDKKQNPINNPIPKESLLQFFERIALVFNARIKLFNNTIYFERVDYYWQYTNPINNSNSGFLLTNLQDNGVQTTNFNELSGAYKIAFARDSSELNTTQRPLSLNPNPNTLLITYKLKDSLTLDKQEQAIKGTTEINIDFARAIDKQTNTFSEDLYREVANVVSDIVSILSFGLLDLGRVEDAKGYIQLSDYSIGIDKIFIGTDNNKVNVNNLRFLNAKYLYDNFHKVSSLVGANQWNVIGEVELSTEQSKFIRNLKQWNVGLGIDRRPIVVTKFDEDLERQTYTIEYRQQTVFVSENELDITEVTL
jgi:hypothetical protein